MIVIIKGMYFEAILSRISIKILPTRKKRRQRIIHTHFTGEY